MTNNFKLIIGAAVIATLIGCGGQTGPGIQVDPDLYTVDQSTFTDKDISLPMNYSEENYRKLVLAVSFQDLGSHAGEISSDVVQTLSARLQTEMSKLNRFTVYSLHNRGGVRVLENLSDIGEANLEVPASGDLPGIDLVLTGAITVSKEHHKRSDRDELVYEVECDFNCEEIASRTVRFSEKAKGRVIRTQFFSLSGKKLGGYDDEDERQAIYGAAMKALAVLANKLGNTYPTGGSITGVLGDRMTLNRGFEDGIGNENQMVVYAKVQGVDLPLGRATASPGAEQSSLVVYEWNQKDKYAKGIIKKLQDDGFAQAGLDLYAVSAGMSVPPEWENAYED